MSCYSQILCGGLLEFLDFGYFVLIWWQTDKKTRNPEAEWQGTVYIWTKLPIVWFIIGSDNIFNIEVTHWSISKTRYCALSPIYNVITKYFYTRSCTKSHLYVNKIAKSIIPNYSFAITNFMFLWVFIVLFRFCVYWLQ